MNDLELTEKVVAIIGAGKVIQTGLFPDGSKYVEPEKFVRDWGVAGTLMERCYTESGELGVFLLACSVDSLDSSLSRAIIEACVQALSGGD